MNRKPFACGIRSMLLCTTLLVSAQTYSQPPDKDSDGDGISDFQELHKHLTNPNKSDSDGDGVIDSDWRERREYQYTVRSVVQVMKPVTPDFLTDDYQDARVLDETETYVELEVVHYPFNSVAQTIKPDDNWRSTAKELTKWVEPGPTSDWTPDLRDSMIADLRKDGIDVATLDDRRLVEKVSTWLLKRAEYKDGFSAFATAFDSQGRPYAPEGLLRNRTRDELQRQWARELSSTGMYKHRQRGSCSSSSIYLSGCLRAMGVPTRTILCIPLVDASDERELQMVSNHIQHPQLRRVLVRELSRLKNSWASHTFNEVYVGNRWRRLNYDRLGQNIYEPSMFGLMTHVATFRDWADAKMHLTIGRRDQLKNRQDVFGGTNPYSTISLRDELGKHAKIKIPKESHQITRIGRMLWTDSKELPADVLAGLAPRGRFGLIAVADQLESFDQLRDFLSAADGRVFLEAKDHRLKIGFDPGCAWYKNGRAFVYVPFGPGDRQQLRLNVEYRVVARNKVEGFEWSLPPSLTIERTAAIPQL